MEHTPNKKELFIEFLRSEVFVLFTFLAITLPLMWHTAYLLLQVSAIHNSLYAWFFAFGFDLAIFTFAINGRKSEASMLAIGVFVLNICFFNLETLYALFGETKVAKEQLVRLVVTLIISGMGSYIVHSYVVFFNDKIGLRDRIQEFYKQIYQHEKEIERLKKVEGEKLAMETELANLSRLFKQEVAQPVSEILPSPQPTLPLEPIQEEVPEERVDEFEAVKTIDGEDGEQVIACKMEGCINQAASKTGFSKLRSYCVNKNCPKVKTSGLQLEFPMRVSNGK